MHVAQDLRSDVWGRVALWRTLKSHPLTTCFIDYSLSCLTISIILFHATSFCADFTAYDWNQEIPLRHSARRIAVWPSGRIHSSHRLYAPKTCTDVSSVHTPINYLSRRNSFETSNLKDWSCTRRINGQIRFKEKRFISAENWK